MGIKMSYYLKNNGLVNLITNNYINDKSKKRNFSRLIKNESNYYHFKHFFKITNNNIDDAIELYKLDIEYRNIVLKYILLTETSLKKDFLVNLSKAIDASLIPLFWKDVSNFKSPQDHKDILDMVDDYKKYIGRGLVPDPYIWILLENVTFGEFLKIFRSLNQSIQKLIIPYYVSPSSGNKTKLWNSTLKVLKNYRNICAHNQPLIDKNVYSRNTVPNIHPNINSTSFRANKLIELIKLILSSHPDKQNLEKQLYSLLSNHKTIISKYRIHFQLDLSKI
jgi:abortive infection bacteriophage resistance protein